MQSPLWDSFWVFAGLWAPILFFALTAMGWNRPFVFLFTGFALFVGTMHRILPIGMVMTSSIFKEARSRDPKRYLYQPLGAVGATALAVGVGFFVEQKVSLALISCVFVAWTIWHFTAQHFGVMSMYRSRIGQSREQERFVDRSFCLVIGIGLQSAVWLAKGVNMGAFQSLLPWSSAAETMGASAAALAAGLTLAYLGYEARKSNRSIPKLIYSVTVGLQPIAAWVLKPELAFVSFVLLYSFPHHMIEVGFQSRIQRNHWRSTGETWKNFLWPAGFLVVLALSHLLLRFYPQIEKIYFDAWFVLDNLNAAELPGFAMAATFILSLDFLHYIFGAYIYNFRNPDARNLVAPFLLARSDGA
jgi:hypothetical protein